MSLIESPLASIHEGLGAKFAEFGGWNMPVEYSGVLKEHMAVRESVGVFDVSHLGTFLVEGLGAQAWLNSRLTNDLGAIAAGQAQYTLLLNERGGVVDDMIVYLYSQEKLLVIPNASNAAEVMARLQEGAPESLRFTNKHRDAAIIAVQGPRSADVCGAIGLPSVLAYMSFAESELRTSECEGCQENPIPVTVCRSGYTGERGVELIVDAVHAPVLWEQIMSAGQPFGILPCGLGARDTLRTEMGYPLHGNDLSEAISPVEARVGWAVGWRKDGFDGDTAARALRATGPARGLVGIRARGRGIPRHGMTVVDRDGARLGEVTSGTYSPTLKIGIGLAFVPTGTDQGSPVWVDIRGRKEEFEVVKPPFVPSSVAG